MVMRGTRFSRYSGVISSGGPSHTPRPIFAALSPARPRMGAPPVSETSRAEAVLAAEPLDLLADEALGDRRHHLARDLAHGRLHGGPPPRVEQLRPGAAH